MSSCVHDPITLAYMYAQANYTAIESMPSVCVCVCACVDIVLQMPIDLS